MSKKRTRSPSLAEFATFRSSPIEDRSSTFVGIYSPTATAKYLQADPDFKSASHRIAGWRKQSSQRSLSHKPIYDLGHDDDGEQYAGKKLERLLADLNVEGAVIVARWYGGVLLGPVRFTHIENCAREAIAKWKENSAEDSKRRRIEEEEISNKVRLAKTLEQRDSNITVLRSLLAEKTAESKSEDEKTAIQVKSPIKTINYTDMNLATLQRLEKARDGTISWILRQIDKVEVQKSQPRAVDEVAKESDMSEVIISNAASD